MFIGEYGKFVYLTYFGTAMALLSMFFMIQGNLVVGMSLFIIAGLCDLFDGMVARSFNRTEAEEQFGVEIDSLCDMINFAALPAVLIMTQGAHLILNVGLAIVYVLAAVSRLAFFNRDAKLEERTPYFRGVPVTYAALFFPVGFLLSEVLWSNSYPYVLLVLAPLLAFLFVWDVKIPKPNRKMYLFFLILAVVTLIGLWVL